MSKKSEQKTNLSYGDVPYDIHLEIRKIGDDLLASVTGGTHSHIGAVSLAEPSLISHPVTGEKIFASNKRDGAEPLSDASCVISVITATGHKDAVLAEMFAKALCEAYGVNVCVTAGVHVDHASQEEIALMVKNAEELILRIGTLAKG